MNSLKMIVVAALALTAQVGWAELIEWRTSDGGNGHYYEPILVNGGVRFYDVNPDPEGEGWHLATLTSSIENLFVYSLISDDRRFWRWDGINAAGPWLGGFQPAGSPEPSGGWTWVTGEPWSFTCWASGEPCNLGGSENYLHYFARGSAAAPTWNDFPGEWPLPGYIRELDVPEPSTLALLATMAGAMILRWRGGC